MLCSGLQHACIKAQAICSMDWKKKANTSIACVTQVLNRPLTHMCRVVRVQ